MGHTRITTSRFLLLSIVLAFLALAVSGGLVAVSTPDTGTYLRPWAWGPVWGSVWGGSRTPFLGLLLAPFGDNFTLLPTIVALLFFAGVYYLYRSLIGFGVTEAGALALTLPLVVSNSLFRYTRDVSPEIPAIVFMLVALSYLLRLQQWSSNRIWHYLAFMVALGMAYLIRPSLIPFIVMMPVLSCVLSRLKTGRWNVRLATLIFALAAAPFITVSTVRYVAVGDFNTVSFGGFNMTGLASSILSEQIIPKLAAENRELARNILEKREAMTRTGEISPMVINYDTGVRDYRRTARSYFDILANNFDELVYRVVKNERMPDENMVHLNRRMMAFCVDVVQAAPLDYAMWVLGGVRSWVGTATVLNPAFVGGGAALVIFYFWLALSSGVPALRFERLDVAVISLITIIFSIGAGALTVLVTYPIIRYVSTSAIFLPSMGLYVLIQLISACRASKPLNSAGGDAA